MANTDAALLKFKFAHLNSVDFKLTVTGPPDRPVSVGDWTVRVIHGCTGQSESYTVALDSLSHTRLHWTV